MADDRSEHPPPRHNRSFLSTSIISPKTMDSEDEAMDANPNRRVKHNHDDSPTKTLRITSFGRRHGPLFTDTAPSSSNEEESRSPSPSEGSTKEQLDSADASDLRRRLSFDIRSIPNPPKHVRTSQSGLYKPLQDWLLSDSEVMERVNGIVEEIEGTLAEIDSAQPTRVDALVEVGINCELGKHRSVAVVETMGKRKWPEGWDVEIVHRDVHRQRSVDKGRSKARKGQRSGRGRAHDSE